jgi:LPXTG-motif cell wall-anchored protein
VISARAIGLLLLFCLSDEDLMSVLLAQFYGSIWWYLTLGLVLVAAVGALVLLRKQQKDED